MSTALIFGRPLDRHILEPAVYALLFALICRFLASYTKRIRLRVSNTYEPILGHLAAADVKPDKIEADLNDNVSPFPDLSCPALSSSQKSQLRKDKLLYHKLQNLEQHPDATGAARERLRTLFDETMYTALANPTENILKIEKYSAQALRDYTQSCHSSNAARYERYIARRRQGSPREMFPTQRYAVHWLKLAAVVKYVDGGWIGNIFNYSLSSWQRPAARIAWQVISEEFGDGDLAKNHVYVYNELLKRLDPAGKALTGDVLSFDGLREDEGAPQCWAAAVAQQCIGLLASTGNDNYLPEALGFNMAYESLPYHLLVTSWELRELGIDDYYFALHVTIDNPDSGHGALARTAVEQYLEAVRRRDGTEAMEHAWRRVQAGVVLADELPTVPSGPIEFCHDGSRWKPVTPSRSPRTVPHSLLETQMVSLLERKTTAAEKMHCPSRVRFRGLTLEQWLNPTSFTAEKGMEFLRVLAEKRPWVIAGESEKSRLVGELEWGGRMFGAFSAKETLLVRQWIESLKNKPKTDFYTRFIGTRPESKGPKATMPTARRPDTFGQLSTISDYELHAILGTFPDTPSSPTSDLEDLVHCSPPPALKLDSSVQRREFQAVWFTHLALLEQFPLSPAKFATPLGATVLRVLRSIAGFPDLSGRQSICAGMDDIPADWEDQTCPATGLWEIGYGLRSMDGTPGAESCSRLLGNLSDESPITRLCADMQGLRSRPYAQHRLLLGLTCGFAATLYAAPGLLERLTIAQQLTVLRTRQEILSAVQEYYNEIRWASQERMEFFQGYQRAVLTCGYL